MKNKVCHDCGTFLLGHEEFCPVCHKKSEFRIKDNKRRIERKNKLFFLFNEPENDREESDT